MPIDAGYYSQGRSTIGTSIGTASRNRNKSRARSYSELNRNKKQKLRFKQKRRTASRSKTVRKKKKNRKNSFYDKTQVVQPYQKVKQFKGMLDYHKNGVILKQRMISELADPTGLYKVVPTADMYYIFQAIGCLIIKRLLELAGMRVSSLNQPLMTYAALIDSGSSNNNYAVQLFTVDSSDGSGDVASTRNFVNTDTVYTLGQWLAPFLKDWSAGFGVTNLGNLVEYTKIKLVNFQTTTVWQTSEIYFDEIMLTMDCLSRVTVQNRSTSQSIEVEGDDQENALNVANHPLRGTIYKFKGVPRFKNNAIVNTNNVVGGDIFQTIPVSSTSTGNEILFSTITDIPVIQRPSYGIDLLDPNAFYNCVGSTHLKQNPGDVRSYIDRFEKKIGLRALIKAIRFQKADVSGIDYCSFSIFPTMMFGYTNLINTRESNIEVAMEFNKTIAMKMNIKKRKYCLEHKVEL